jgi:hypothetical protein
MTLENEIKSEHDLYYADPVVYAQRVNQISDLLELKGQSRLMPHLLPTYIVGNYQDGKSRFVLFGMNPGYNEEGNAKEESLKKGGWDKYQYFTSEFFRLFKVNGLDSRYYKTLSHLFSGIDGISLSTFEQIYDYYYENLISIDLIPYHSTSFGITNRPSPEQLSYLKKRLAVSFDFIATIKCRMVILHGALFATLVRDEGYLAGCSTFEITKQTMMYTFKYKNIPSVLFSRMITQPGSGVTHYKMEKDIPELLKTCFD